MQGIALAWFGAKYRPLPNFENEQKLPKMVFIIHNFLVLRFGEKFMKIRPNLAKLQMILCKFSE